jgi:hypothetical protein
MDPFYSLATARLVHKGLATLVAHAGFNGGEVLS